MQKSRQFWIFVGVVSIIVSAWAFYATYMEILNWKFDLFHSRWILLLIVYIATALAGLVLVVVGLGKTGENVLIFLEIKNASGRTWKVASWLVFAVCIFGYFPFRDGVFREFLPDLAPAVWVTWLFSLIGCTGLKIALRRSWPEMMAVALASVGIVYQVLSFFPNLTNYPFSLGWSEGSSLYYASLINGKSIYGQAIPLSSLNPTYYFLRGIPFFFPGLPLIAHRIWNVMLWVGITLATSVLFIRRLNLANRLLRWLTAGWFFLFLISEGAVHYELLICVIIILWGVSIRHPYRTLIVVIFSSIWAGMSRLNWYPIPALLAIAIYLLEKPVDSERNLWAYFKVPFVWAIAGIGAAFISQYSYIYWSGNGSDIAQFTTSLSSTLLWYRLLPNTTFPLGILPGIFIFSLPVILGIAEVLHLNKFNFHPTRLLGLGGILLILLAGGSVVSAKIGGGSDLHNLDSFRIMLALIAASFLFGRVSHENSLSHTGTFFASWIWPLLSLGILVVFATPAMLKSPQFQNIALANGDLQKLQGILQKALDDKKSVLFISQRQLLATGMLNTPLIPEYELVELTEMAMAGNHTYLAKFRSDIKQQQFDIIVTDLNTIDRRPQGYPFMEENNVWVDNVYSIVFCEYNPEIVLENASVQVMSARKGLLNCR